MVNLFARRISIWFVVVAVALTSAWVGFQMAQGQTMAELGESIGIDMLAHKDGHKEPPPCGSYGNPPRNPVVPEKNKNCDPDN